MICQVCGAKADEIKKDHYRCAFCGNEFDAPVQEAPKAEEPKDFIKGNVLGSGDYIGGKKPKKVLSGEEIYERAIDSVVEIYAKSTDGNGSMCSSGFVISEKGFVLTNAHAVLDEFGNLSKKIQVKTQKGVFKAIPIAIGRPSDGKTNSIDLCLLYVEGFHTAANTVGNVSSLKNGQKVYLIGNSLGEGTCITSGIISEKQRAMPGLDYPYIMTDAAANPGNSGGPLYNESGEVIGVLVAGIDGAKGMNYAIPANIVDVFMTYIFKQAKVKNVDLGELNKYTQEKPSTYALDVLMVASGVKLFIEVFQYIAELFKRK